MSVDPLEDHVPKYVLNEDDDNTNVVDSVETSTARTAWRTQLANEMYEAWWI
ncbi:unnamed protein product, partial [Ilex paraguariensis]